MCSIASRDGSNAVAVSSSQAKQLRSIFTKYCNYGAPQQVKRPERLTGPKFERLLRDTNLFPMLSEQQRHLFRALYLDDMDMQMDFSDFLRALGHISASSLATEDGSANADHFSSECSNTEDQPHEEHQKSVAHLTESSALDSHRVDEAPLSMHSVGTFESGHGLLVSPCSRDADFEEADSESTTSTQAFTLASDAFPLDPASAILRKPVGPELVQIGAAEVELLHNIFEQYAPHWCSGAGKDFLARRCLRSRPLHATSPKRSSLKRPRFIWTTSMCFGGFASFAQDYQIATIKALSRYPYERLASTPHEKIALLFKRMQVSQAFADILARPAGTRYVGLVLVLVLVLDLVCGLRNVHVVLVAAVSDDDIGIGGAFRARKLPIRSLFAPRTRDAPRRPVHAPATKTAADIRLAVHELDKLTLEEKIDLALR
ncbi:Hypothetical Protein FCC1311_110862 [Hondaea fermentalgiana]|uniref:EF-hand domain-containing protein n=1 Tax=Hondaea fermentalgiana TaxID=2315210 RepID=A0A2R5H1A6_9STRA|nr:Hypothetical Protein FCC1311_110862 [Hondaea fermentalgiana]|eukprot:GBG34863.1 Hypothetical Protein FCC1311_110862 [Hondaea fermentalgiana]